MYLGQSEQRLEQGYLDGRRPTVYYAWRHVYQCERCGRLAKVLERADEPFYCRCDPRVLISIEPAPLVAG